METNKKDPKDILLNNFPELLSNPKYSETIEYFNDLTTIIYEDAFVPYILDLINEKNPDNQEKLDKAFDMIEEMLDDENFNTHCLAEVSFIEPFLVKLEPTKDVERYLRPKSIETARELARKWFKIDPDTWEATA